MAAIRGRHRWIDHAGIVAAYLAGASMSRCGEMFGCAHTSVESALNAYHVVRRDPYIDRARASRERTYRQRPLTRKIRSDVQDAYNAGNRTAAGIARELGVAAITARKHLQALHLTPEDGRKTGDKRRRPDLSPADIRARYEAGETCSEIAASLSTVYRTVRGILQRQGVELRDDRPGHSGGVPITYDPSLVTTVLRLYDARFSYKEVSAYCGINPKAVARILTANGVTPRPAVARTAQDRAATHGGHIRALGGAAAIREWAAGAGLECPARGLPPTAVLEAYIDAHPQPHPSGGNTP